LHPGPFRADPTKNDLRVADRICRGVGQARASRRSTRVVRRRRSHAFSAPSAPGACSTAKLVCRNDDRPGADL